MDLPRRRISRSEMSIFESESSTEDFDRGSSSSTKYERKHSFAKVPSSHDNICSTPKGGTSIKRQRMADLPNNSQKKLKFEPPPLNNTLENLDLSSILEQNIADDDDFSQSFNTQMVNQLELVISHNEGSSASLVRVEPTQLDESSSKALSEFNILQSFSDKLKYIHQSKQKNQSDTTISNSYKKEVDDLFEQIEHSICAMGTDLNQQVLSDEILDVIFAEDPTKTTINDQKIQEQFNKKLTSNSDDDLFEEPHNSSFGSIIKQALINNASRNNAQPSKPLDGFDCTLNQSLTNARAEPEKLGNFFGLPDRVGELLKHYKGIEKLYDWQEECLNMAITNKSNLIYALPTSGGKTLVAEILMLREVLCYKTNAIFVLPYVAIVQEKVWDFSPFGVALDFLVEEYAASKGSYPPRKRRRKRSVYIATIEKALGLVNSLIETGRLNEIGLVVVDELHLIGEEGRGATLEAFLSKILLMNGNTQIIGMSATIGNIHEIAKFLKAMVYTKDFRPVELTEYVKCENQIARVNWGYSDENDLLVDGRVLDFKYADAVAKLDPDMLGGLVLQVIPKGSCLVFCPSKSNCENVAYLLCKLTKPHLKDYMKTEKVQLLEALREETGELCDTLKVSVPFGIAYHHSGLTSEERRLLEDAFRSGVISVICCTSTLAAGVNLPAKRVILRSPYIGRDFINLSRYKQMVGRAGRAGFQEVGESILVTNKIDLPKVKQFLMSPMNQALSNLHMYEGRGLRHLLLSCISLGIANTRAQLQNVAKSTLMAVQVNHLEVNIKKLTDTIIKNLFKLGALQEGTERVENSVESQCNVSVKIDCTLGTLSGFDLEEERQVPKRTVVLRNNTKMVVSSLGAAAIKAGLDLIRAHQLYDDLCQAQKSLVLLNCLHLLYLITPYDTAEQVRPNIGVFYDVLSHLGEKEQQTAKILGFDEGVTIKMATGKASKQVPENVLNRFYLTLMLYDLWNEVPVFKVSEKYQINRGIVQNMMTLAATFASNVVNFCDQLEEFWAFSHLLKGMSQRLSHCCIRELLPLMELPAVKQSRAKQLYNAGYKNLQTIAKSTIDELVENIEFMPRKTASQLIAASKMLLLEKVENLREEAEDVLDGVDHSKELSTSFKKKTDIG